MTQKIVVVLALLTLSIVCFGGRDAQALDSLYFSSVPNEEQENYLKQQEDQQFNLDQGAAAPGALGTGFSLSSPPSDATQQMQMQKGAVQPSLENKVPATYGSSWERKNAMTGPVPAPAGDGLPFFGETLFKGRFTSTYHNELNPSYKIQPGDRIGVNIWGSFTFSSALTVDAQGNIFLPTIGPIRVMDVSNSALESLVRRAIDAVYSSNYDAYINLLTPQPLAVYVTGFVRSPGRYAGGATDSVLYFVDMAGGVDFNKGSLRDIRVVRNGKVIATVDMYGFLLSGNTKMPALRDGDTIVVPQRGIVVGANGSIQNQARFEFFSKSASGEELMQYSMPEPSATNVRIRGFRKGVPYMNYIPIEEFAGYRIQDGDIIDFVSDVPAKAITIYAEGALEGNSHFLVNKGTKLYDVLNYIAVDRRYADLSAIHLRRMSVAMRQKMAIDEALYRLEQTSLTAPSATAEEAQIRAKEAEMIQIFVKRAQNVKTKGVVVLSDGDTLKNIYLEDDDIIVIPPKNDVIMISGQVISPATVVYDPSYKLADYIEQTGGYEENADEDRILVVKPDGRVAEAKDVALGPGDHIMVLPRYDSKNFQMVKAITEVLYKITVGAAAAKKIWDD